MDQSCLNNTIYTSKSQKLLLKTAFAPQNKILSAWEEWYAEVDIEDLDSESYHLLPSVYYNLSLHKISTPEDNRLKGIYRRFWYSNQIHLQQLKKILDVFNQEKIEPIILGDLAIALKDYPELAMRPIYDYELFVIPQQAYLASKILVKLGWQPKFEIENLNKYSYPKLAFTNDQGQLLLLYWELWTQKLNFNNNSETILTKIAKKILIGTNQAYILNAEEQVLNICLKNVLSSSKKQSSWLADLKYAIASSEIDWQNLLDKVAELRLNLSYQQLILELNELAKNLISEQVIIKTKKLKVSSIEVEEFKIINQPNSLNFKDKLTKTYLFYFRTSEQSQLNLNLVKFAYYLKYIWSLKSMGDLLKKLKP